MATVDAKGVSASAGLASVGGQQFASAAEAEAGAQRLAQAVGHEAVVVKDERDHFWVVKASDLARLPAATAPSRSTDPKRALAPGKRSGVRGFQVVKTAKPVAAVALPPSTREAAVTTGERLLAAYSRQSELLLNAVYADKYVDWIDTLGNTKRLRPADASTVMLRLNASIWSVVRDLRNGTVPPADVGLPQGTKWESAKAQVPARAIYDLAMKRLHADSLDYRKVIPEMLKDPLWAKQPIVINDPEKGTYPLSPDKVSWLQKSEYVFFAPNNASETAEALPIVRSLRDHAVAEAEAAPDRAPAVADANLVHTAYGLSRGKGLAANNSQATLAMSVAAQVPLIVPELAEPGTQVNDLKAKQRTGEIAGYKEVNGSVILFRPKSVEAIAREVRAKIDAGQLAHLGPEALGELRELTGPDSGPGKDLVKRLESEGRSRFWRGTTGEIVDMALIGVASGGIASFAEGVAVGMRAAPAVIKTASFLTNSASFTTLSGMTHGQLSADRYAIDIGMFAVLGQAGRFSALAGKLVSGNTATLRFLQSAAAQTATVATSAAVMSGFTALEAAAKGDPLSKREIWQQFGHNLLIVGTLHAVNTGIARLTPEMAPGARVRDEIERLRTRADRANASLTGALDELSCILVDAAKTPAGTPKQAQLTQRAEQVLAKVAAERQTVERLSNDVKDFARRSLPPEQGKALLRDIEAVEETLGVAREIATGQEEVRAAVAGKTSPSASSSAMSRATVSTFQHLTDLVVMDSNANGIVDRGDKFFETGSKGLQEVSFSEAERRYAAATNSGAPATSEGPSRATTKGSAESLATGALKTWATARAAARPLSNDQLLFCLNKTPERIKDDFARRIRLYDVVIGTKATQAQFMALKSDPALLGKRISFDEVSRVLTVEKGAPVRQGLVVVAAAGAADLPVAEESARIAEAMGNNVTRLYDFAVGDAHDASAKKALLGKASAIIAVSGDRADLPNTIATLTDKPIVAVPTGGRFGDGLGGVERLMGQMASWASGVSVVNTDNGFGAAYVADKVNRQSLQTENSHPSGKGFVVVTTAGSADIPVAERAAKELERLGNKVVRLYDRGVNDPSSVSSNDQLFQDARVIVVAAGLEGGLPNAVAAVTQRPVVAVPTSVGYGTGKGGVASLMSALNACSPGISVVSIDDASAAAAVAHRINRRPSK